MTNIETSWLVSNHRQRVSYRMLDSIYRSDAQGADATSPWNILEKRNGCLVHSNYFQSGLSFLDEDIQVLQKASE
jgi:hypothetical protein